MFDPKGEIPEWRIVYDHAVTVPVDGVVTYEDLDALLGRTFTDSRAPIYRVQKELLENDHRTMVNVIGVGYRVGKANEHAGLASGQRKRARHSMTKAVRIVDGTNRQVLTRDETVRLDRLEFNLKQQAIILRKQDSRIGVVEKTQLKHDDRLDLLVRELRSKGIDVTATTNEG